MCSKTIVVANKSLVIIGCMVVNEVKMGIHLYYKWDKPKQMDKVGGWPTGTIIVTAFILMTSLILGLLACCSYMPCE